MNSGFSSELQSVKYACLSGCCLESCVFEGEHFVFNPETGETHLLNATAHDVLRLLEVGPMSVEDMARHNPAAQRSENDRVQYLRVLLSYLRQLESIGLVERLDEAGRD